MKKLLFVTFGFELEKNTWYIVLVLRFLNLTYIQIQDEYLPRYSNLLSSVFICLNDFRFTSIATGKDLMFFDKYEYFIILLFLQSSECLVLHSFLQFVFI